MYSFIWSVLRTGSCNIQLFFFLFVKWLLLCSVFKSYCHLGQRCPFFFSNLETLSVFRPTRTVIDDFELNWTGAAQCNRAPLRSQNAGVSHWLTNFMFFLPQRKTKINMLIAKTTWTLSSECTFSHFVSKSILKLIFFFPFKRVCCK